MMTRKENNIVRYIRLYNYIRLQEDKYFLLLYAMGWATNEQVLKALSVLQRL